MCVRECVCLCVFQCVSHKGRLRSDVKEALHASLISAAIKAFESPLSKLPFSPTSRPPQLPLVIRLRDYSAFYGS